VPGLNNDDDGGDGGHTTCVWSRLAAAMLEKGCGGTLKSAEGVWDGAVRLQCLLAATHRCNVVTLDGKGCTPQCGMLVHSNAAVAFGWPFCGLLTSTCAKHRSGISGR